MTSAILNLRSGVQRLLLMLPGLLRQLSWLSGRARLLMQQLFAASVRGLVVMAVIVGVALVSGGKAEKAGDDLQIALPLLAWGCAAANGDGAEFFGRYLGCF